MGVEEAFCRLLGVVEVFWRLCRHLWSLWISFSDTWSASHGVWSTCSASCCFCFGVEVAMSVWRWQNSRPSQVDVLQRLVAVPLM